MKIKLPKTCMKWSTLDCPKKKEKVMNLQLFLISKTHCIFQAAELNTNARAAVEKLQCLKTLEWAIPKSSTSPTASGPDSDSMEQEQWIPFLSESLPETESKTQYLNIPSLRKDLQRRLPGTNVKVFTEAVKIEPGTFNVIL